MHEDIFEQFDFRVDPLERDANLASDLAIELNIVQLILLHLIDLGRLWQVEVLVRVVRDALLFSLLNLVHPLRPVYSAARNKECEKRPCGYLPGFALAHLSYCSESVLKLIVAVPMTSFLRLGSTSCTSIVRTSWPV